ncbi:Uncharacterised protein [Mycobacterium tuberculosis]|nr:Uncharacterised protein [Mycobacterium tuberculosis]
MEVTHLTCYNLYMPFSMTKNMLDCIKTNIKPINI